MEMIRNSMLSYRRAWVQDIGKLLEKSQREKSCSEGKIRVNVLGMVIAVKELDNRLYVCIGKEVLSVIHLEVSRKTNSIID